MSNTTHHTWPPHISIRQQSTSTPIFTKTDTNLVLDLFTLIHKHSTSSTFLQSNMCQSLFTRYTNVQTEAYSRLISTIKPCLCWGYADEMELTEETTDQTRHIQLYQQREEEFQAEIARLTNCLAESTTAQEELEDALFRERNKANNAWSRQRNQAKKSRQEIHKLKQQIAAYQGMIASYHYMFLEDCHTPYPSDQDHEMPDADDNTTSTVTYMDIDTVDNDTASPTTAMDVDPDDASPVTLTGAYDSDGDYILVEPND